MELNIKFVVEVFALALIFSLETLFPFFKGRKNRAAHAVKNIALGTLNAAVIFLLLSTATVWVTAWARVNSFGLVNLLNLPPILKGAFAFILFDLWAYGIHIANHRVHFLWRFHRVHHADMEMDATTALRFHTGEVFLLALMRLLVIPVIGMEFIHLMIYEICLQPVIIFHHSNVALPERWERIFRTLIVTPSIHRVHHSQEWSETNSNYASIFSFWDRIGKTFIKRENPSAIIYGLPEMQDNQWRNLSGMIKMPFVSFPVK